MVFYCTGKNELCWCVSKNQMKSRKCAHISRKSEISETFGDEGWAPLLRSIVHIFIALLLLKTFEKNINFYHFALIFQNQTEEEDEENTKVAMATLTHTHMHTIVSFYFTIVCRFAIHLHFIFGAYLRTNELAMLLCAYVYACACVCVFLFLLLFCLAGWFVCSFAGAAINSFLFMQWK